MSFYVITDRTISLPRNGMPVIRTYKRSEIHILMRAEGLPIKMKIPGEQLLNFSAIKQTEGQGYASDICMCRLNLYRIFCASINLPGPLQLRYHTALCLKSHVLLTVQSIVHYPLRYYDTVKCALPVITFFSLLSA